MSETQKQLDEVIKILKEEKARPRKAALIITMLLVALACVLFLLSATIQLAILADFGIGLIGAALVFWIVDWKYANVAKNSEHNVALGSITVAFVTSRIELGHITRQLDSLVVTINRLRKRASDKNIPLYRRMEILESAQPVLQLTLDLSRSSFHRAEKQIEFLEMAHNLLLQHGNFEGASTIENAYIEAKRSLAKDEKIRKIIENASYELEESYQQMLEEWQATKQKVTIHFNTLQDIEALMMEIKELIQHSTKDTTDPTILDSISTITQNIDEIATMSSSIASQIEENYRVTSQNRPNQGG